jgi:hypothetical protein
MTIFASIQNSVISKVNLVNLSSRFYLNYIRGELNITTLVIQPNFGRCLLLHDIEEEDNSSKDKQLLAAQVT